VGPIHKYKDDLQFYKISTLAQRKFTA